MKDRLPCTFRTRLVHSRWLGFSRDFNVDQRATRLCHTASAILISIFKVFIYLASSLEMILSVNNFSTENTVYDQYSFSTQ